MTSRRAASRPFRARGPDRGRRLTRLLAAAVLALGPAAAASGGTATPSWMEVDEGKRAVKISFVSGWNANNNAWNYNGYYEGSATIVVPQGWRVEIRLRNQDGNYPHSMVLTRAFPPDALPGEAGRKEAAISRAYTREPGKGLFAGEEDSFRFRAKKAGTYYLFCGVPGHGLSGMWIRLEISAEADAPYVIFSEGAEPGAD